MTRIQRDVLLELLEGDDEFLQALADHGLIEDPSHFESGFEPEEVETILVSRTLVRDLEVNWAGVEVIVRMRRQLLLTRRRLAELADKS